MGPLSEMYGRNIIYRVSYVCFFALTFPTAFPPNIGTQNLYNFTPNPGSTANRQKRTWSSDSSPDYVDRLS